MVSASGQVKQATRSRRGAAGGWSVRVLPYVYATVGVTLSTVVLFLLRPVLQWSEIALLYLPLVIACATRFGFGPAVLCAVLSFACCDYFFLQPYYTLFINSPRGWLSLMVFLFAAIVTARLVSRVRDKALEAEKREREATMLYEASQAVSAEVDAERLLPTLAAEIVRISEAAECAVLQYKPEDHSLILAGYASTGDAAWSSARPIEGVALAVLEWGDDAGKLGLTLPEDAEPSAGIYLPLHVQSSPMGVLFVRYPRDGQPFTEQAERLIRALADHAAVVIARQRHRLEAEMQSRQTAIVEERNRLSRDVHDALSHTFTGIKFLLEAADKVGPTPAALECIAEAKKLAVEGAQEARRSVLALRPAQLVEAGDLVAAIRALARRQNTVVDIDVEIAGEPFPLAADVEENLLRMCQEALGNVLRHADAGQVTIGLAFEPGEAASQAGAPSLSREVVLSVKDDGVGFDPEAVIPGTGFGLTSMRQRAARLGGRFSIASTEGEGTEVTIRTPVAM